MNQLELSINDNFDESKLSFEPKDDYRSAHEEEVRETKLAIEYGEYDYGQDYDSGYDSF